MRRITLTCFAFASLAAASCSSNQSGLPEGPAAESAAPIVYGTADTAHTAVVALLNPDQGGYDECSGTIVQVSNGVGYVLTAGHCCTPTQPTIVIINSDYSVGLPYINSSNPPAPTYAVNASSVQVDPAYVPTTTHDFCMLTFNGAPAGTATIPVATSPDGLALNTTVEYVGFGVTTDATNNSNTLRYHASAPVNLAVAADTFSYNEGGGIGGPCEGDSGGPALLPSGAAQSTQRVVGTTSYGSSKCQPAGSTGVDMRVTSATGPGGFITTFLGGTSSSSSSSSSSSTSSSSGGAPGTCSEADGTTGCCAGNIPYYCASGSTTVPATTCTGTKVCGWNASKGYYACVAAPGGTAPGDAPPIMCGGSSATTSSSSSTSSTSSSTSGSVSTSSSSSSSGTTSCGLTTGDPTCDACINGSCCSQATACANDSNCIPCLQATPVCTNDPAATAFNNCLGTSCVAACSGGGTGGGGAGGGTTTTTTTGAGAGTTTGTGTGTGAGNTTGTGTGTGTASGNGGSSATTSGSIVGAGGGSPGNGGGSGNGNSGTGNNGTSGGNGNSPGNNSGCNVASGTGSSDPSAPTSLAGMLLGAALVFSRRRR